MENLELVIPGLIGDIEAMYHPVANSRTLAIICHPHPLYDGSMDNKVITMMTRSFHKLDISVIRFNYRGVGGSYGSYGSVYGEVEDAQAVMEYAKVELGFDKFICAGFSFGAYVAAELCVHHQANACALLTVAPSVERMPYAKLAKITVPWLVIMGEEDEVVSPQAVYAWYDTLAADKKLIKIPKAKHFFHGKLIELEAILLKHYKNL